MVTAALHRRAPWGSQIADALVVAAGKVIGYSARGSRLLPGLGGAALMSYGTAMIYRPAGFILGGVFLVLADRQIKLRPPRSGE